MDTKPLVNLQVPQPEQALFKQANSALEMAKA